MSKVENLIIGLHKLTHQGELNKDGLIRLGPQLGFERGFFHFGIYGEGEESNTSYFARIHEQLSSPKGIKELEKHYEALSKEERRGIGRTINEIRRT